MQAPPASVPLREPAFRQLPMYDKLIFKPSEPFSLLSSRALTIGDVDNDKDLELVIGTTGGDLFIIKHDQSWRSYSGLQIISAVAIGDIYNCGKNCLIVTTCECSCYVFEVSSIASLHPPPLIAPVPPPSTSTAPLSMIASTLGATTFASSSFRRDTIPKPTASPSLNASSASISSVSSNTLDNPTIEQIAPNAQVAVLFDYDADGKVELLIGRSDRAVDCYVMAVREMPLDPRPVNPLARPPSAASATSPTMAVDAISISLLANRYHLKKKASWKLAGEVASIAPVLDASGKRVLLVGQQAGSFAVISQEGIVSTPVAALSAAGPPTLLLPNGLDSNGRPLLLVATLNTPLRCFRDDGKKMWDMQLDPHLCALARVYPSGPTAPSAIVACSYDGMTYVVTKEKQAVQLPFCERVCAFTAGDLTVFPGQTMPCLVYVTADGRVFVHYGLRHLSESLNDTDIIEDLSAEFEELRLAMGVTKQWSREEKMELLTSLWYNADRIPRREMKK